MARQSPHRNEADEPQAGLDATDGADRSLWDEVRMAPVEIALPAGAGYTLRAYRLSSDLTPTEVEEHDEDDVFDTRAGRTGADEDDDEVVILDEEFAALVERDDAPGRRGRDDDTAPDADEPDPADFADDAEPADEEPADEDEADDAPAEEVPVFLSHRGRLLLFKSPESLVEFVRSGAPHDLAQLDTWSDLAERLQPRDIAPLDEDTYELDLVVDNLRGGHDAWDVSLLIEAGEVARDLAYALRLRPVLVALSPGSPLDDLDEALRAAAGGGVGRFMGRRRLRRIGAQQASLGWRAIIGKISAAVDWRD